MKLKNVTVGLNNWMSAIDDRTNITNMAIPGTHDSGAFEYCLAAPATQAHEDTRNIRNQLDIGVRSLDIRCGQNTGWLRDNDYYIYHGPFGFNTTIKSVITTVADFLTDNPTEFVILVLKQENGSVDISNAINKIVKDELGNKLYKHRDREPVWPQLLALRGKALVLNRLKSSRTGGLNGGHYDVGGWAGNPDRLVIQIPHSQLQVVLQDKWSMPSFSEKKSVISGLLHQAFMYSDPRRLYLNFMSYSYFPYTPYKFGKDTNKWLIDCKPTGKGVISVDGVDEDITEHIVNMNN
jgi:1-phosphatidylinositol phosphodiesterase